jgi:hypothetical protein
MTTGISQATTDSLHLAYLEESVFGTVASGAPRLLRNTGGDLGYDFTMQESEEINEHGQVTDAIIVDASAGGGFKFEQQYHEYDPFWESLLRGTFSSYGTGGVKSLSLTFNLSAGTVTGIAGDFTGLVAGQWFSVTDSDDNDGYYRIGSMTSAQLTVDASTPLLANEGPTAAVLISSTRLSIGTAVLRSFSIEQAYNGVNQFFMHNGRVPVSADLDFTVGSKLTGSFATVGKNTVRAGTTQFPGGAPLDSNTYGVMSAAVGVGSILVRDAAGASILGGAYINGLKLSVNAGNRDQKALGNLGAIGVGKGSFSIKATAEIYLLTGSIYDAALANSVVSLQVPVVDTAGNGYVYIFNDCKLNVPKVPMDSKNKDVVLSVESIATAPDSNTDSMIMIDRFGASVVDAT